MENEKLVNKLIAINNNLSGKHTFSMHTFHSIGTQTSSKPVILKHG